MTSTSRVTAANPADSDRIARLLSDAFLAGPLADWLVPDLSDRQRVYPRYWNIIADHAVAGGAAIADKAQASAAALWYAVETGHPDVTPVDYQARLADAVGEALPRFLALDAVMHDAYPADFGDGYAYLGFMAVHPLRQRRGLGRALLDHRHAQLDARASTSFLIASSAGSARLYESLGYRPYGALVRPGAGAPALIPMARR